MDISSVVKHFDVNLQTPVMGHSSFWILITLTTVLPKSCVYFSNRKTYV